MTVKHNKLNFTLTKKMSKSYNKRPDDIDSGAPKASLLQRSCSVAEELKYLKKKKRKELESEHLLLQTDHAHAITEKQKLQNMIRDMEHDLDQSKTRNDKLEEKCLNLEKKLDTKDQENIRMTNSVIEVQQQITDARVENMNLSLENADLKNAHDRTVQENQQLRTEVLNLEQSCENTNMEICHMKERLSRVLEENKFYIYIDGTLRNVQVGNSNTIQDNPVRLLEDLVSKLTSAVEDNTTKRKDAEIKLKNDEVLIKEMKDTLNGMKENLCIALEKLDQKTSKSISRFKCTLDILTSDRSDEYVIKEGMVHLRRFLADGKPGVCLPIQAQATITRLVNKFGGRTANEFAKLLELDLSAVQQRENTGDNLSSGTLNKQMCRELLSIWMKQSDENNASKLLAKLQSYESEISEGMVRKFQQETVGKSVESSTVNELSGIPDAQSQFMHHLSNFETVMKMDWKLADMYERVKDIQIKVTKKKDLGKLKAETTI